MLAAAPGVEEVDRDVGSVARLKNKVTKWDKTVWLKVFSP